MLSDDVLFSIMLEMDIKELEIMCHTAHSIYKLCNTHFWNTKINKDFDIDIANGSIEEYTSIFKANKRAVNSFNLFGSMLLNINTDKLYKILPPYLHQYIDQNGIYVELELIPEWKNIDGKKYGGYIKWDDEKITATRQEMEIIYTKYIYFYRKILLRGM